MVGGEQRRLTIQVMTTEPVLFLPGPGDSRDSEAPEWAPGDFLAGAGMKHTPQVRGTYGAAAGVWNILHF